MKKLTMSMFEPLFPKSPKKKRNYNHRFRMEEIEPSKADLRNKFLNQLIFRGSLGQTDQLALQSALAKKRKFKRLETDFNVVNLEMLSDNEEYQKSQRQRYKKLLRQDK